MTQQEMIEKAKEYGQRAFEQGEGQVPVLNSDLMKMLNDNNVPVGQGTPILQSFVNAWHQACDREYNSGS